MGKCKFKSSWLDKTDDNGVKISEWGKNVNKELFCTVCNTLISVEKGFHAIKKHANTDKHKGNYNMKKAPSQLLLKPAIMFDKSEEQSSSNNNKIASSLQLYSVKDSAYAAELIWTMQMISSNLSVASCAGVANVFRAMFPNPEAVPKQFCLNPTKAGYYITDALAPYFRDMFLTDLRKSYYSLQFDETTNSKGTKELQVLVRYWAYNLSEVTTRHLETFYMGHATGRDIKENLITAIQNADLSLTKILMLASDGPNVNKTVFGNFNEDVISIRNKGLVDIGFCNIHVMHNAYLKGLEVFGSDASELIIALYNYFNYWPSRWEDFSKIQSKLNLQNLRFIKHVSSRWLTMEEASNRLLQNWDAVLEYFLKFIPLKQTKLMNSASCKRIVSFLKKRSIKIEIMFVCVSAQLFTKFTGFFQREEPLIHLIYDQMKNIVIAIMGRVCKLDAIDSFKKDPNNEAFKNENLLHFKNLKFGEEITSLLSSLKSDDKNYFLSAVRKHYVAAGNHILKKTKGLASSSLLRCFSCLNPSKIKNTLAVNDIIKIANSLPININTDHLLDEWKSLQAEELPNLEEKQRIDHYWNKIFIMEVDNKQKYPLLTIIVKASLTLIHGSADVERLLSRSSRILTEERAAMGVRMLNARLIVSDAMKDFHNKPELVPISKKLLNLASQAYKSYNNYLEDERKKKEEKLMETKRLKELRRIEKEKRIKLNQKEKDIEKLNAEIKSAKKEETTELDVCNKLLDEANEKLKNSLEKGDVTGAKVAQVMIEGAMKAKEQHLSKRKHVELLEKQKDYVITNFFSKKLKTDK